MAVIVASMLALYSCGEDCAGFSSFTDENGLIACLLAMDLDPPPWNQTQ